MDEHTGSTYEQIAADYADDQDKNPWHIYYERPAVIQFLPDVKGKDVLDAGCGPGFYSQYLAERGAKVTAFDLNPVFVGRTRDRTAERVTVLRADLAEALGFADSGSFDLVICILVLHYLKDWEPPLRESHRVLRSDGRLVFSTHHPFSDLELSPSGDYFATDLVEDEWDIGKVQFYRRPLSAMASDLYRTGFVIEEISEPRPTKPPDGVPFESYERSLKTPMRLLLRARKAGYSA